MTHVVVSNITPRTSYSPTTGTSYTIPSTWGFFASSDIVVYSGTTQLSYAATPTSSTNFATSGSAVDGGYQGGNIVLGAASTANTITLILEVPVARETDFPYPSATINIEDLNTDLDKSYVLHQQFVRDLARTIQLADSDTGSVGTLPQSSDRAGKFAYFDTTGGITAAGLSLSGTTVSVSAFMLTVLDDASAAAAVATLGAISDPTTTAGDTLYRDSTGVTRRAIGSAGTVLASTNSLPAWRSVTSLLDELFGSTQGGLLYRGSSEWAALAAGTSGQFLKTQGTGANPTWASASATNDLLLYQDVKSSGTGGDAYTAAGWRTVTVNTEVVDTAGIGSLSTNQITLSTAGSYEVVGCVSFQGSTQGFSAARVRLRNISTTETILQGANVSAITTATNANTFNATIAGSFTTTGAATLELQIYPATYNTLGAQAVGTGESEIYSYLALRRYA